MRFNPASREIVCKVVYYGPGLAGKTTNLQAIRDRAAPGSVSELVSVDTHSERTLHFDLLALDLGQVQGYRLRIEFFTVPGQNYYAATRRQVLAGADGAVFVADSRREALDENIDAMNEMLGNLRHHGLPDTLPVVVQYNKQDLPTAVPSDQLDPLLNVRRWPSQAAIAIQGRGVAETCTAILRLVADAAAQVELPRLPETDSHHAPAPVPLPAGTQRSWLISCHRCSTMLEVPDATIGARYTCGVCASSLEVVDADRGLTRVPQQPSGSRRALNDDSGGYAQQTMAAQQPHSGSALGVRSSATLASGAIAVEGYDAIGILDDNPQGRRLRVRERAIGRTFRALILSSALMRQPGQRDNLEPFARLAGPIRHPNVLPLVNMRPVGEGMVFFSADPQDHEPLSHVLARRRALAPPHAMGVLRQLALALEEAARHGVVHGWLRPDVVLVSAEGNVLLDELTLAKNQRFLVRELSGASAATEYYLAPEHLNEEARSDLRSDMFILGALLFRMITGEGLVTGYTAHEALHKLVANGPRPLRAANANVSRDLDAFYKRLTAVERKDRFQNYGELIDSLDRFGGGAKRQTMRLTGNLAGASVARVAPTGVGRKATGNFAMATAGTATGGVARRGPSRPESASTVRPRPGSGGLLTAIIIGLLIAGVGVGALWLWKDQQARERQERARERAQRDENDRRQLEERRRAVEGQQRPQPKPDEPRIRLPGGVDHGAATAVRTPPVITAPTLAPPAGARPSMPAQADVTPGELAQKQRMLLLHEIADLKLAERFQEALDRCAKLPADERGAHLQSITELHDRRRREVETRVTTVRDLPTARSLVEPGWTTWGMPGDAAWAKGLLAAAEKRLAGGAPPSGPDGSAPVPTSVRTPTSPLAVDPARVDVRVCEALNANQREMAELAVNALDSASAEARALTRKLTLWDRRVEVLERAIAAKQAKLRVTHQLTKELCDIVAVDATTLELATAVGSTSRVPWPQVSARELAKVFADATATHEPGADLASALVMQLLGDEPIQANLILRRLRPGLPADALADLDLLLVLNRQGEVVDLLARADEALKAGDVRRVESVLADLKRPERAGTPNLAGEIQRLDDALLRIQTGRTAQTAPRDRLPFDSADELHSFTDQAGTWQVAEGRAVATGDSARLGRRDLANARSLLVIFQPVATKGALAVDFRGVRVVLDFAANAYALGTREAKGRPKPFTFVPRVANTLYLECREGKMLAQLNNGVESAELAVADFASALTITLEGAAVSFDEIAIVRETNGALRAKQASLRQIGWEPLGDAHLEGPAIVLPAMAAGQSGIAFNFAGKANIQGIGFEAHGSGPLRISAGRPGEPAGKGFAVPLPATGNGVIAVRWSGGNLVLLDSAGKPLDSMALSDKSTHLMIHATREATIHSAPRPIYQ